MAPQINSLPNLEHLATRIFKSRTFQPIKATKWKRKRGKIAPNADSKSQRKLTTWCNGSLSSCLKARRSRTSSWLYLPSRTSQAIKTLRMELHRHVSRGKRRTSFEKARKTSKHTSRTRRITSSSCYFSAICPSILIWTRRLKSRSGYLDSSSVHSY